MPAETTTTRAIRSPPSKGVPQISPSSAPIFQTLFDSPTHHGACDEPVTLTVMCLSSDTMSCTLVTLFFIYGSEGSPISPILVS
ncbi:hypothetical protein TNCV_850801 [Trichonephila clavipes]|nr:hypothetical protein TNCV_850801 [Trichonephila clavipes]